MLPGPRLLEVKKRKKEPAAPVIDPSTLDTQLPEGAILRAIPSGDPPSFLPDMMKLLELHPARPFSSSLQYKAPFRQLRARLAEGTCLDHVTPVMDFEHLILCRRTGR